MTLSPQKRTKRRIKTGYAAPFLLTKANDSFRQKIELWNTNIYYFGSLISGQ